MSERGTTPVIKTLKRQQIRTDGGTQSRAGINQEYVARYRELYQDGRRPGPLKVFFDGENYWLAAGFHRLMAGEQAGLEEFECEVIPGTLDQAIDFSLADNQEHGAPRTDKDINFSLVKAHSRPHLKDLTGPEMANVCGCSKSKVNNWRKDNAMRTATVAAQDVNMGKLGKAYTQAMSQAKRKYLENLEASKPGSPAANGTGSGEIATTTPASDLCPAWVEAAAVLHFLDGLSQRKAAADVEQPESTLRVAFARWADHLKEHCRAVAAERLKSAVKDEPGNVVPAGLVETFRERESFDRQTQALKGVTQFLNRIAADGGKAGKYILARASVATRDAYQDISRGRPYAVCAACKGKGASCDHCRSLGFLDESSYKVQRKSHPELFDAAGRIKP